MSPSRRIGLLMVVLSAGAGACTGVSVVDVHTPSPEEPPLPWVPVPAAPAQFSCDPAALPEELPLPRLSRVQLANTLRFAIERALPEELEAIWAQVEPTFARYPREQRTPAPGDLKGGFSRLDQSIQQSQVDAMYDVGQAVARELTRPPARLGALLGGCAVDGDANNDRGCLEAFVREWGARVLRAPLPAEEVAFHVDIAGSTPVDPAAVADVITTLLNSPRFLYRVESGTDDAAAVAPLSAYELASRLSYQFWQAPPDDALWAAAADGSLLTPEGFDVQLTRLLQSPRLRSSLDVFMDEWLRLEELPSLVALRDDPVYRSFVGEQMPTEATRAAMIEDVQRSAWQVVSSGGSVSDFLWDRRSYTHDAFLASIYEVPAWDGTGPAPLMPSERRSGLLTRAALLATGTASTRPIHKGYLVRNALLCQQVGAPPPNASSVPPAPTATATTREAVTALTSGVSCSGCHDTAINPQGFVLEGFDALGRERLHERLFDARGQVTSSPQVDTVAEVHLYDAEVRVLGSAVGLTRAIDESKLLESCLARQYFRFSHARVESEARDGCLLSAMEEVARSGAPLAEVLKTVARQPGFKHRRFQ